MPGPQEEPEIIASVFLEHLLCAQFSSERFDHTKYLMSVFRCWARRGWVQIQTSVQRYHLLPSHPGLESLGSCPERLCPHPSSHSSSGPAAAPPSAASFLVFSPVGCDWDVAQGSYSHLFHFVQRLGLFSWCLLFLHIFGHLLLEAGPTPVPEVSSITALICI